MGKTDYRKFQELAKTGTIVPVYAESLADMETPVSVFARFVDDERVFLLESVEGGERFGRYSFIGVNPRGVFRVEEGRAYYEDKELPVDGNPLDALKPLIGGKKVAVDADLPPLPGGAVGYLAYEAVNMFEELPPPKGPARTPDVCFMLFDEIIVFDNIRHTLKLIVCVHRDEFSTDRAAFDYAQTRIAALKRKLSEPRPAAAVSGVCKEHALHPETTREEYCAMVEKAKRHIRAGDVIQIVPSQRLHADAPENPLAVYRALRLINPSPYTFFLKNGTHCLIGSSPETMVKLSGSRSNLRPIAGTRKRGATPSADRLLADELLKDEKERAEHLMLVDLGRNDLGRTAVPGSVQVRSFMNVERYSHVMHLVSDVEAVLRPDSDAFELLKTTFPAGTLSGAPKIRAMELINELEPSRRGCYGGCVGYISYDGNMDMAITIRTIEILDGRMSVQAGAGVVFDSVPEKEYEETLNKAGALFQAVKLAERGLEEI